VTLIARLSRVPFLRFAVIGAFGYVVDTGVLWFGTRHLGLDPYSGRALSIFVAMFFTWLGNRYLTFAARAARGSVKAIAQEWMKFVGANTIGAVVNYSIYAFLIYSAFAPFDDKYIAQACGTLGGMVFNFLLSKHFVFSTRKA
jgi:putative flippase GtrA